VVFLLFIGLASGFTFWFSTKIVPVDAGAKLQSEEERVVANYKNVINEFIIDYYKADDKKAVLQEKHDELLQARVPKQYLSQHLKLITLIDRVLEGKRSFEQVSQFLSKF